MGPDFTAAHVRQMLLAYMGANDFTQKQLAMKVGISAQYLNDILLDKREPQGKVLEWLKLRRVVVYRRAHPTPAEPK